MTKRRWRLGVAVGLASLLPGCDAGEVGVTEPVAEPRLCTQRACETGAVVRLHPGFETPGRYDIVIRQDGTVTRCEAVIGADGKLEKPQPVGPGCEWLVWLTGGSLLHVKATETPVVLEITIRRAGHVVLSKRFTPEYRDVHPNGEDCPEVCKTAQLTALGGP